MQDITPSTIVTTSNIPISDPPTGSAQKQATSHNDHPSIARSESSVPAVDTEANADILSIPLDGGCMKFNSLGTANYVGSSHWAAVLDSIAELKEHFEQEEENRNMATELYPPNSVQPTWPQLLYGLQPVTKAEILSSIPPRRAVDRLVSKYFTLDIASGKSITPKLVIS